MLCTNTHTYTVLGALIVSPFISFVLYFGAIENGCMAKFLKKMGLVSVFRLCLCLFCVCLCACFAYMCVCVFSFSNRTWDDGREKSEMAKWIEEKVNKHLGFIFEAFMEALPVLCHFLLSFLF